MNKRDIEMLAVNAVRESITVCDCLDSYLNDNDKTPSWDGEIYIYNNPERKKENLRGIIKSQIKGKVQEDLTRTEITYSVKCIDLRNFLLTGNTIYFVVYISPDKKNKQIYYNDLNPVKLNHYLKKAKGKTVLMRFKVFPSDVAQKTEICVNLFDNSVKQSSLKEHILSLEDLQTKNVTQIQLSYVSYNYNKDVYPDIIQGVLDNSISLYAQLDGSGVLYPIDTTEAKLQIERKHPCEVAVGERIFYSYVTLKRTATEMVISIGDSVVITHVNFDNKTQLDYRLSKSLRSAAVDLAFMNAAVQAKEFRLGNKTLRVPDEVCRSYDLQWGRSTLAALTDYVLVFDILHVEKDIKWATLTRTEQRDLNTLVTAFVKKESVYNLRTDLPPICIMRIQDVKLLLGINQDNAFTNAWHIHDVFQFPSQDKIEYKETANSPLKITSIYSVLREEDYSSIDNINYEILASTYKCLKDKNPDIISVANRDLLIMLKAYDNYQNDKLLYAIEDLAEWILNDDSCPEFSYEFRYLNLMQAHKRKRNLTDKEKEMVYDIFENDQSNYDIKTAAALLLEDSYGAKRNFMRMSNEEQDFFRTLPIYHIGEICKILL